MSVATEKRSVLSQAFDRPHCLSGPYSGSDMWPCHVPLVCVGARVSVLEKDGGDLFVETLGVNV